MFIPVSVKITTSEWIIVSTFNHITDLRAMCRELVECTTIKNVRITNSRDSSRMIEIEFP
jgi:hypothetical protein